MTGVYFIINPDKYQLDTCLIYWLWNITLFDIYVLPAVLYLLTIQKPLFSCLFNKNSRIKKHIVFCRHLFFFTRQARLDNAMCMCQTWNDPIHLQKCLLQEFAGLRLGRNPRHTLAILLSLPHTPQITKLINQNFATRRSEHLRLVWKKRRDGVAVRISRVPDRTETGGKLKIALYLLRK